MCRGFPLEGKTKQNMVGTTTRFVIPGNGSQRLNMLQAMTMACWVKKKVEWVWFRRRNETKVCQKASILGMAIYKGYHLSKIMNQSINLGPESLEWSSNNQHPEQKGVKFGKYYHYKYIAKDFSRSCVKSQRKQRGQKSLERKEILTPLQRKTDRR